MTLRRGTPEEAGMSRARVDRARQLCTKWVDDNVHKAISILVARNGVVCLDEGFGTIGPTNDPLDRDALFPIWSLTKMVTATCVMMLVDDGLVGLTRPVQEYLPEFAGEGKDTVLVHHLLTHTSGIGNEDLTVFPPPYDVPLVREPGVEMEYANYNYYFLGEIVGRVSGRTLAEFAAERLFAPLDMQDTTFKPPDDLLPRIVEWRVVGVDPRSHQSRERWSGSHGVYSTAADMANFGQMFLDGGIYRDRRVLSRHAVREMMRDQIPGIPATIGWLKMPEASWGYGWGVVGDQKWPNFPSFARGTTAHMGGGTHCLFVDSVHQLVGAYFSVCRFKRPPGEGPLTWDAIEPINNVDLFVNVILSAVDQ